MNVLNQEKFLNEMNSRWLNKNCQLCGKNNWNIERNMVTVNRIGDNGEIQLGGTIMPLVAMTCMNCGNVVFVNPLVCGAVDNLEE